jgi:hypothetical protein
MNLEDFFMPYRLVDVDHGVPVFSLRDINLFGLPDLWGVEEYLVLDDPTESCPFVLDYDGEQERRGSLRPIHRYSQYARFKVLVNKFLGGTCNLTKSSEKNNEIVLAVAIEADWDTKRVYNSVRQILKKNGWSRYYDNIPSILEMAGYEYKIKSDRVDVEELMNDFRKLSNGFESIRGNRKYMLNYRFIALKLMERYKVVFEYEIPLLQTARKFKEFEDLWEQLIVFLD